MNRKIINIVLVVLLCGIAAAQDSASIKALTAKDYTVPGIGMKMKLIPAGTFTMGSPAGEMCRRKDEVAHKVKISKPFYMGVYEVTQREFYKLMTPPDYD